MLAGVASRHLVKYRRVPGVLQGGGGEAEDGEELLANPMMPEPLGLLNPCRGGAGVENRRLLVAEAGDALCETWDGHVVVVVPALVKRPPPCRGRGITTVPVCPALMNRASGPEVKMWVEVSPLVPGGEGTGRVGRVVAGPSRGCAVVDEPNTGICRVGWGVGVVPTVTSGTGRIGRAVGVASGAVVAADEVFAAGIEGATERRRGRNSRTGLPGTAAAACRRPEQLPNSLAFGAPFSCDGAARSALRRPRSQGRKVLAGTPHAGAVVRNGRREMRRLRSVGKEGLVDGLDLRKVLGEERFVAHLASPVCFALGVNSSGSGFCDNDPWPVCPALLAPASIAWGVGSPVAAGVLASGSGVGMAPGRTGSDIRQPAPVYLALLASVANGVALAWVPTCRGGLLGFGTGVEARAASARRGGGEVAWGRPLGKPRSIRRTGRRTYIGLRHRLRHGSLRRCLPTLTKGPNPRKPQEGGQRPTGTSWVFDRGGEPVGR